MINSISDKEFELAFLSNEILNEFLEVINTCEENGDTINIVWQMKFKSLNYILYRNCIFSTPLENRHPVHTKKILGKKIKIKCDSKSLYSDDGFGDLTNSKTKYKDGKLLNRMLKINELNLINKE